MACRLTPSSSTTLRAAAAALALVAVGAMAEPRLGAANAAFDRALHLYLNQGAWSDAAAAFRQAYDHLTDNGRDAGGQHYRDEAFLIAGVGHAAFRDGHVAVAGQRWRDAIRHRFAGAERAQRQAERDQRWKNIGVWALLFGASYLDARSTLKHGASPQFFQATMATLQQSGFDWTPDEIDRAPRAAGPAESHWVRVPVTPDLWPFDTLVRVQTAEGYCTGSFVGPALVLTNAHCLFADKARRLQRGPWQVIAEGSRRDLHAGVIGYWTAAGFEAPWDGSDETDWALLDIERQDWVRQQGYLGHATGNLAAQRMAPSGGRNFLAGYSGDLNRGAYLTMHHGCGIEFVGGDRARADCSIAKGSSGAPLVSYGGGNFAVAALNAAVYVSGPHRGKSVLVLPDQWAPTLARVIAERR